MKSLAKQLLEEIESIKEDVNQSVQQGMDSVPDQSEQNEQPENNQELEDIDNYMETSAEFA